MKQIIMLFALVTLFAFAPPPDRLIKVVPNPVHNKINVIDLQKPVKAVVIAHWITGLPIINDVSGKTQEDLSALPAGNYYVVVTYTDNTWDAVAFVKL